MRPDPTHLSLAVLTIALAVLGTVSYIGAGDDTSTASRPVPVASTPLLPPQDGTQTQSAESSSLRSALVHPLIGTGAEALRAQLGDPAESYASGRFTFLTYRDDTAEYQVVLQDDAVVEVSRIN